MKHLRKILTNSDTYIIILLIAIIGILLYQMTDTKKRLGQNSNPSSTSCIQQEEPINYSSELETLSNKISSLSSDVDDILSRLPKSDETFEDIDSNLESITPNITFISDVVDDMRNDIQKMLIGISQCE